jgi:hypothetical protein
VNELNQIRMWDPLDWQCGWEEGVIPHKFRYVCASMMTQCNQGKPLQAPWHAVWTSSLLNCEINKPLSLIKYPASGISL